MKVAFLTEMGFQGKVGPGHPNMRTEFAWMMALEADHFNIHEYGQVKGYDAVLIIFPKGMVKLNAFGVEMTPPVGAEKDLSIYTSPIVEVLKLNNKKVCSVQEGPSWLFNDYDLPTQFHFYNQLAACDIIFAHNGTDIPFYAGLFPNKNVSVIPTLMVAPPAPEISHKYNRVILGGNFCRWYGGFQSYMVATELAHEIYVPSSHCKRQGEEQVPGLTQLPWVNWNQWMEQLSQFKYAVHLMPTVAAGTFSMNCAYWGIPCIGNVDVDTQHVLYPRLSVKVDNVYEALLLARRLKSDDEFYRTISAEARYALVDSWHFNQNKWRDHMLKAINE